MAQLQPTRITGSLIISSSNASGLDILSNGANGINITSDGSDGNNSGRLFFSTTTSGESTALINQEGDLGFRTKSTPGSSTGTERMRITKEGNIGIGYNSPTDRLHISGNIRFRADASSGSEDFNSIIGTPGRTSIKDIITDASYENTPFLNPETFNAFAGADKWAEVTASNVYNSYSTSSAVGVLQPSNINEMGSLTPNEMFRVGGNTFQPYFSGAFGEDLDEIVIEINHENDPLRYTSMVGIQFTHTSWRARRIKIETYTQSHDDSGTDGWVTTLDIDDHSETTIGSYINARSGGVRKTRFTLGKPSNAGGAHRYIRINKIFGYDYKGVSEGLNDAVKTGTYYLGKHDNSAHYGTIYPATGSAELGKSSDRYANIYADNLRVDDKIYHYNDSDTYIDLGTDAFNFYAGGFPLLKLSEEINSKVVINENGNDVDFRVESQGDSTLLFTEGSTNRVGIGTDSPAEKLTILGNVSASGNLISTKAHIGTPTTFTASTSANTLVIGDGVGSSGITIYSQNNGNGSIFFADDLDEEGTNDNPTGNRAGVLHYNHTNDEFQLRTAGNQIAATIDNTDAVFEGNISASGDIEVANISASNDIIASNVIADLFSVGGTTLIETETLVSSGSNIFGSGSSNTHEFIGDITASGNLSSSIGSTASFGVYFGDGSHLTGVQTVIDSSSFAITGSNVTFATISASNDLYVSGNLKVESSGSTIFEVVGDTGQLFSIDDGMSGSLFAVSDVSGLPILEVFSDDTIKLGSFNDEAIIISGSQISSNLDIVNDITSSGNISSSGTITAGTYDNLPFTAASISGSLGTNASLIRSLTATAISGAFEGQTGSFVVNSETSSFVVNSQTSSFVVNSQTGSFVTNSQTSSFVVNSQTSSFVVNSQTGSFVVNSQTGSFVINSQTGSFVINSQTGSFVVNSQTGSFVINSQTSSFVVNSQTGSFVVNSQTSSFVVNSQTSSFLTSSPFTAAGISGSLGTNASLIRSLTAAGISGSLGTNATLIRSLTAAGISGSLGTNATLIRSLTAAGISGSLGTNATLIRSLTAAGISGSLGTNATLIRSLTAAGISGSLGTNATLIRSLTAAGISGSLGTNATLIRSLTATAISGAFEGQTGSFAVTGSDVTFATISASNDLYVNGTLDVLQSSFTVTSSNSTELEVVGNISASGQLEVHTRKLNITSTTDHTYSGDVVYFGTFNQGVDQGEIIRYDANDDTWRLAHNTDAASGYQLLGIALGENSSDGALIRGFYTLPATNPDPTKTLYVGTGGVFTQTVPSGNGEIVRVLGNVVGSSGQIYFNPSSDWITIDA